jgi:hypothetical protein
LTLDITVFGKPLAEPGQQMRGVAGRPAVETPDYRHGLLPGARSDRPRASAPPSKVRRCRTRGGSAARRAKATTTAAEKPGVLQQVEEHALLAGFPEQKGEARSV